MSFRDRPGHDPAPPGAKEGGLTGEPEESPSLPGLPSWKSLYWYVFAVFILCIALMRALQEFFS